MFTPGINKVVGTLFDSNGNEFNVVLSGSSMVTGSSTLATSIIDEKNLPVNVISDVFENANRLATNTINNNDAQGQWHWDNFTKNQSLPQSVWTTVYEIIGAGSFHGCVFRLNHDRIFIRILVDGNVILEVDLDELHDDFDLDGASSAALKHSAGTTAPYLSEFNGNKSWRFQPPNKLNFKNLFTLQMMGDGSNNRSLTNGLSTWQAKT